MRPALFATASVLLSASMAVTAQHQHAMSGEPVSAVRFDSSCRAAVMDLIDRGVALLHASAYQAAHESFRLAGHSDPDCAIAWWGMALSQWGDPFESRRSPAMLEAGRTAITGANAARSGTARERQYIAAVAKLFQDYETVSEAKRLEDYSRAMRELATAFPDDPEAAILSAVALNRARAAPEARRAGPPPGAMELLKQLRSRPKHPGALHYLLHVFDDPRFSARAVEAGEKFATVAPATPHVLHLSSHASMRLGEWQAALEANLASADAARRDDSAIDELHALDYQVYAYLQMGRDRESSDVTVRVADIEPAAGSSGVMPLEAWYVARSAIPARYALERGDWAAAAALPAPTNPSPLGQALRLFARVIGAARLGPEAGDGASDLAQLQALSAGLERVESGEEPWARHIDILRRAAAGWWRLAERRSREGLTLLRSASDDEDATEPMPYLPGPLIPARELYAEALMELGRPRDGFAQFEQVLARHPRRLRALAGAARAAALSGRSEKAAAYYAQVRDLARMADDPVRPLIEEARRATTRR